MTCSSDPTPSGLIFDLESDGLLPELTKIHCIWVADTETGQFHNYTDNKHEEKDGDIQDALTLLSSASSLIGHNIQGFDIPAIQKVYPEWTFSGEVHDTLIYTRLLWPEIKKSDFARANKGKLPKNMIGRQSLESWGYRLGIHKGDFEGPWDTWTEEMHDYCGQDVNVNLRLWEAIQQKVQRERVSLDAVRMEHIVQQIIDRQHRHGFRFDVGAAGDLYGVLVQERQEITEQLQAEFPGWWSPNGSTTPKRSIHYKDRQRGDLTEGATYTKIKWTYFKPSSRPHIAKVLMDNYGWQPEEFTEQGEIKVDETVLEGLDYPPIPQFKRFLLLNKRVGQIADGQQAWLKKETNGRIHGRVNPIGAVTRRMTHSDPNLAQVPAAYSVYGHECRSLFTVGKGHVQVGCDASALELCCLAGYMARYDGGTYVEAVWEGDKAEGTDIHSMNARALGLDPTKKYSINGKQESGRDIAKTWFYAYIYGAGDEKLGWILGVKGKLTMVRDRMVDKKAQKRGKQSRAKFEAGLPALGQLVEAVKTKVEKHGFIRAVDGVRLNIRSPHSALNTLLQSAGAIFMKRALVILDHQLQEYGFVPGVDYEFIANVHDEWQIEVYNPANADTIGSTAAWAIKAAGEYYNFGCPLGGDYKVGANWAETH